MATELDHELVRQATLKRIENPNYQPTLEELKAVDQVLIEQARARLATLQTDATATITKDQA
jgi:hypothetical protein